MAGKIVLKGVKVNNLKNIDVAFEQGKLNVVTGLSGSGKSSLVFDTLYAEGQRRYVESLSSYARQFLGRMQKPEVDFIEGIAPAIAIEQKALSKNPRSTVGTVTEIYEYLKLLYARIGRVFSPVSGREVKRHSVKNVADFICGQNENSKIYLLCKTNKSLDLLVQMGYSRLYRNGELVDIGGEVPSLQENGATGTAATTEKTFVTTKAIQPDDFLFIDRWVIHPNDSSLYSRVFDSVQTAFSEGDGKCYIVINSGSSNDSNSNNGKSKSKNNTIEFSNILEMDGMKFVKPSVNFFSFNNPYGACPRCEGMGNILGYSEDLVIPNPSLSVFDNAVACWRGEKMQQWKNEFIISSAKEKFPIHKPYKQLTREQKNLLWNGSDSGEVNGIMQFFADLERNSYKMHYRILMARYKGKTTCPECNGSRLRKDADYVKIGGYSIGDLVTMPVEKLVQIIADLKLTDYETKVSERMLKEINNRLGYLMKVGLPYLTLSRVSSTLSGGEAQRIYLADALGSTLVGSMYILDEPSIGLHPRDTQNLIEVLKSLRDEGNTVIVVEHDREIMQAADHIIDIGPYAGKQGGEVVFDGTHETMKNANTLTAKYLRGELEIPTPKSRRKSKGSIEITGVNQNNLNNVSVKIPLGVMTVVTGVSGSGKTSLIKQTLYPALGRHIGGYAGEIGRYEALKGDLKMIGGVEMIDQNPIGRSSRSNPVSYIKVYDDIRSIFANTPLAKKRGYKAGAFSFNVEGGRCEVCQGEGVVHVEMQFMADIEMVCDECHGKRFKQEILEIQFQGKNIFEILNMTVDEAVEFFTKEGESAVANKLSTLQEVGLGYLCLGQQSSTLSGGEAQRIKLAYFIGKGNTENPTLFIFDEPTTGLHFHDINNLLNAFAALIRKGHTVIVIEHHPDIIKVADHIIDIGPEGGEKGGNIIFEGTPEMLVHCENSITGKYINFV